MTTAIFTTRVKQILIVLTIVLTAVLFALNLNTGNTLPATSNVTVAPQETATRSILLHANGQLHIMEVPA